MGEHYGREYPEVAIFSKMIPTQEKGNMHGRIMVRSVGGPDSVKCTHKMFGKK